MSELDVTPKGAAVEDDVDEGGEATPAPNPELEALKAQAASLTKQLEDQRRVAQQLAFAAIERGRAPAPPPKEEAVPDREEDPEAWMAFQVKKQVESALSTSIGPLVKSYDADRARFLDTAVRTAKAEVATKYGALWAENAKEIEEYLAPYPAEVLSNPRAVEEALFRVVGQKSIASPPTTPTGPVGRQTAPPTEAPTKPPALDDRTARMVAREGMSVEAYQALKGSGKMTVDDYLELAAKEKARVEKKKGAR